jgi:protoheme IX farnesyltransferase
MKHTICQYLELTKPKVTLLNLLVGVACFFVAAFPSINWWHLAIFSIVGYMACGGCGVLNCVYEKDIDKLMQRTSRRAIPSGAVSSTNGSLLGLIFVGTGISISYFFFNALTALMMVLGTIFYLLVYTVALKRTSNWNVVIGGFAGCFAALSGWTAVTGSVSLLPLLISIVDFLWTPGHLWGLAMKKVSEYQKAKIPMLPVTSGLRKTAEITFVFNISAIAFSLFLPFFGFAGLFYSLIAISGGIWFTIKSRNLLNNPSKEGGFNVFMASMPYLSLLMVGLMVDKTVILIW